MSGIDNDGEYYDDERGNPTKVTAALAQAIVDVYGFDAVDLRDSIVNRAASMLIREISPDIKKTMLNDARAQVDEALKGAVEHFLHMKFRKYSWKDDVEDRTIKQLFEEASETWLNTTVDSLTGKPTSYKNKAVPRIEYLTKEATQAAIEPVARKVLADIMQERVDEIRKVVGAAFEAALQDY